MPRWFIGGPDLKVTPSSGGWDDRKAKPAATSAAQNR